VGIADTAAGPDTPPAAPADEGAGLESAADTPAGAPATRFPCIDGVRALAALAVVLTHAGFHTGASITGPLHGVLSRLDVGVAVFFVLSGFLLHRPQVLAALRGQPQPAVRTYLWRRALRVLPAAWVAVVLVALLLPFDHSPAEWLRQLTLTAIYVPGESVRGLTQLWSLATEVAFYLALPVLGRLAARRVQPDRVLARQLALCAGMYAVALLWQWAVAGGLLGAHLGYWLPAHTDWFALGMALAALSAASDVHGSRAWSVLGQVADDAGSCWLAAGALFALATTPLTGPYQLALLDRSEALSRTVLYGAVATLVLLPAVAGHREGGGVRRLLASAPAQFLGRISYGVFLLHLLALELVMRIAGIRLFDGRLLLVLALTLPLAILLGWGSLHLVEEPALRWRDRGPGRRPDAARPAPAAARG